jgi:hypothetical protein
MRDSSIPGRKPEMKSTIRHVRTALALVVGCAVVQPSIGQEAAVPVTLVAIADTCESLDVANRVGEAIQRDVPSGRAILLEVGDLGYPVADKESLDSCQQKYFPKEYFAMRLASPGNHDFKLGTGESPAFAKNGYFPAVPKAVDLGKTWRLLLLDSTGRLMGMEKQVAWIRSEIVRSTGKCVIAAWHHPRWSSAGDEAGAESLWAAVAGDAALTLHGHDHHFERLAPANANGDPDPTGTRSFIVGNGGARLRPVKGKREGSFVNDTKHGFLHLELREGVYIWTEQSIEGEVLDRGEGACTPVAPGGSHPH